jgi:UDP-N-acetylglucosamine 4-epimerase
MALTNYESILENLKASPKKWLVTGAAGFIGSNLAEELLKNGQKVVGVDNFLTGHKKNIEDIKKCVGDSAQANFEFIEGDVTDYELCKKLCQGVDVVLHQAAVGSVPRSIEDPLLSHKHNVDGFISMAVAAKDAKVSRFVYASSSSVYGDHPNLPKVEEEVGNLLSPYAATKKIDELYADVFNRVYGLSLVGLRYFNVFGKRQDPEGPYAAVIPKWVAALLEGQVPEIYGDGETSRDFCYIQNAVQANILAGVVESEEINSLVLNVACGQKTTLNELYNEISRLLAEKVAGFEKKPATYKDFRPGDIRHSLADISLTQKHLGYDPQFFIKEGLEDACDWYIANS